MGLYPCPFRDLSLECPWTYTLYCTEQSLFSPLLLDGTLSGWGTVVSVLPCIETPGYGLDPVTWKGLEKYYCFLGVACLTGPNVVGQEALLCKKPSVKLNAMTRLFVKHLTHDGEECLSCSKKRERDVMWCCFIILVYYLTDEVQ